MKLEEIALLAGVSRRTARILLMVSLKNIGSVMKPTRCSVFYNANIH